VDFPCSEPLFAWTAMDTDGRHFLNGAARLLHAGKTDFRIDQF
jgi:hypothetical protein